MTRALTLTGLAFAASLSLTGLSYAQGQDKPTTEQGASRPVPTRCRSVDGDSGNAKNPALPECEQGKGQETGGPARNRLPD
jgi:hypothetical protein